MALGDWCVLLDHDDTLPVQALACIAEAVREHPEADVLFSDEDRLEDGAPDFSGAYSDGGRPTSPLFKPGFDPDLFLSCNIVSHIGVYRTAMLRRIGGFRTGLEGSQDYDLALRILAAEGPGVFVHIPHILYHWRRHEDSTSMSLEAKPYAREAGLRARREYLASGAVRGQEGARVELRAGSGFANIRFALPSPVPLLSLVVVIGKDFLERQIALVKTLCERTRYAKREILFAASWDMSSSILRPWERLAASVKARLAHTGQVTFTEACNQAVKEVHGGIVAFVRAGDVPAASDWAEAAVGALCRDGVAVAACRSLSPEGFLHQAGYAAGYGRHGGGMDVESAAGVEALLLCPAYNGLHVSSIGYYSQAHLLRSVPGAYASGFFCRRDLFERLGGFDPRSGELADADFCLRAWTERRLRAVMAPDADMLSALPVAPVPATGEFETRWGNLLRKSPPFQNPCLAWTYGGWRLHLEGAGKNKKRGI
jgi:hypothetical protein